MIGKTVLHYRVTDKIGAGGMGVVYKVEDTRLNRSVAMKFLPVEVCADALSRSRFEREAQTASALNHPNICTIHDIGEYQGQPYIVMELIKGQTIKQLIAGKPLKIPKLVDYAMQTASALEAAHEIGIIHRDIKTSNILVDERGFVKLLDFGLAKLIEVAQAERVSPGGVDVTSEYEAGESFHTTTGTVVGTTNYMSPEQARGDELDARSDLFSLGIVMYEMATGKIPFRGKTVAITFDEILNKQPTAASILNPDAPPELDDVINKAMAKSPSSRYQSARELIDDLKRVLGYGSRTSQRDTSSSNTSMSRAVPAAGAGMPSIAVLPFVNLSGNTDNDYFGDGLAEDLIGALMKVDGIQVAARTSTFQFKGQTLDVAEIGQRLNVTYLLEGSFRMAGSRIRILANFINVADGYQLWADRFDRDMEDVFALQDEITQTIVNALEVTISGRTKKSVVQRPTDNVDAYNHYLRGRYHWKKRTPDAIHKAVECFKQALEMDPHYAVAHAGLADCYAMLGTYAVMPRKVVMPQAKAAAEKAISLDDSITEAHAALGLVQAIHEFQWDKAERSFERSLELAPDYSTARYWFGIFALLPQKRFDEAMGQAQWAAQLDPVDPTINGATGLVHVMQRQYSEAIASVQAALELDPANPLCNITIGWALAGEGRYDEALDAFNRCKAMRVVATGGRAWVQALAGETDEAEMLLGELAQMSRQGNSQADFEMARVNIGLGRHDAAFECLHRTYDERAGTLFWLNVNPLFDPLRNDPQFNDLLEKLNLL